MKVAAVVDENNTLQPLDMGSSIILFDDEKKEMKEYENPGFANPRGGKEIAMSIILRLKPDAVLVKEGFLCPGSYGMSRGRIKYIPAESEDLTENIKNISELKEKAQSELSFEFFRENE
ncbi:TVG0046979 [Thermoplasma volcanium GSS1]|uniref:TVG0046979 protein n=1 Tax=Thermoplasma volcanium (strain ATCC 51530 / DSM 4299 / JCM 9571 / NBRC 15438 / GSS1) TaxID=273116 RepID=Q97CQ7_THEVO|nr:hypothetical protein [Thermoplasma volcanium]BAB59186.1 TVG0046979 [Thermoplasma volcanium GSS1]